MEKKAENSSSVGITEKIKECIVSLYFGGECTLKGKDEVDSLLLTLGAKPETLCTATELCRRNPPYYFFSGWIKLDEGKGGEVKVKLLKLGYVPPIHAFHRAVVEGGKTVDDSLGYPVYIRLSGDHIEAEVSFSSIFWTVFWKLKKEKKEYREENPWSWYERLGSLKLGELIADISEEFRDILWFEVGFRLDKISDFSIVVWASPDADDESLLAGIGKILYKLENLLSRWIERVSRENKKEG